VLNGLAGTVNNSATDIDYLLTNAIVRNGSKVMTNHLQMGFNSVRNMAPPTYDFDAANAQWVNGQIAGALNTFAPLHNNLSGLQGGQTGQLYHVTAAEQAFLTNVVNSGLPIASTTGSGLLEIADTTEVGATTSNAHALTPNNLASVLTATGSPTEMQKAIAAGTRVPLIHVRAATSTTHPAINTNFNSWDFVEMDADGLCGFSTSGAKTAFGNIILPWSGYYEVKLWVLYDINSSGGSISSVWCVRNNTTSANYLAFAEGVIQNNQAGNASGSIVIGVSTANTSISVRPTSVGGTMPSLRPGTFMIITWIRPA
jgi:hypothetical protein